MSLEKVIGYEFKNKELLERALTHKSFFHESNSKTTNLPEVNSQAGAEFGISGHNEKLEFLGDAVVDLAVSELLMMKFPKDSEGNLSKKRASLVNETVLAEVAERMELAQQMIMGKGELLSGGGKKPRLLSSTLEALIGAVFIEAGYERARDCLKVLLTQDIEKRMTDLDFGSDFKTRLQEIVQGELKAAPTYRLVSESGPSHDRVFEVEVNIVEYPPTRGVGRSKKAAEQEAARLALQIWQEKEKV